MRVCTSDKVAQAGEVLRIGIIPPCSPSVHVACAARTL